MEFNESVSKWFGETAAADYEAYGRRSPEWDAEVKTYLAEYSRSHVYPVEEGLLERLEQLGEELQGLGCSDPLVLYQCGAVLHRLERPAEARPLIEKSLALLEKSDYPRRYAFYAARRLEWVSAEAPGSLLMGLGRRRIEYLGQAAADPNFADGNQRYHVMDVLPLWDDVCGNPSYADDLINELDATADVDPWIEHVVKGRYHVGLAWKARGGAYAYKVTAEGWEGFAKELAAAEEHLVAAHQLHPEFPEPAAIMIIIAMAGHSALSEREWFDRSVAAQFDYPPAYNNLLQALQPRWGGSHRAMYKFGVECLDTGRFDTKVPRFFLKVVWDIGSEMDDWRTVYQRPNTYRHMKVFFNGVLTEPSRKPEQDYFKSAYGIIAWAAEEYQDARKLFDELGDKVDLTAFREGSLDVDAVLGDVYLRTGTESEAYIAAEKLFDKSQSVKAISLYEGLGEEATDNPHIRALLQDRLATLKMKKRFLDGDWASIFPDGDLTGWEEKGGLWTFEDDGSLKATRRKADDAILLVSKCIIDDNYEIRAKVTVKSDVGVMLGYRGSRSPEYVLFNLDRARLGGLLAKEYEMSPIVHTINAVPETSRFHLQVWGSQVTVYVNDEPVFVAEDVSELGSPRDGRIGIGALAYRAEGYSFQYHSLEIRRLTEKPKKAVGK